MAQQSRKPTIHDVALAAGVSIKTVSNFVNQKRSFSAETALRIERAIQELGYRPNMSARGLRGGKKQAIGLIGFGATRDWSDSERLRHVRSFEDRLVSGVYVGCEKANVGIMLLPPSIGVRGKDADILASLAVDGLLYGGPHYLDADPLSPGQLLKLGIPAYQLGRDQDTPPGHGAVFIDEDQVMEIAVSYLAEIGHRRITYLEGPVRIPPRPDEHECMWLRNRAFWEWADKLGIRADCRSFPCSDFFGEDAPALFSAAWDGEHRPTAILCFNDLTAEGVLRVAEARGIRIPQDVSIMGIDDNLVSELDGLTTVQVASEMLGERAVELIQSGERAKKLAIRVASLVIRASVRPI